MTRSIPLTVDTNNAIILEHPSDSTTSSIKPSLSPFDTTLHILDSNNLHYLTQQKTSSLSTTKSNDNDKFYSKLFVQRYQIIIGFCLSIFIFAVILATLVTINLRRRRLSTVIVDKETLIDNEFSPDFQNQTVHV